MKTIQKLTLTTDKEHQTLSFKAGYRIVRIEYLVTERRICLWVEIPLRADIPETRKTFVVKKTNESVPSDFIHVHTAVDLLKPEAFHIFEVPVTHDPAQPGWDNRMEMSDKELAA
ncbi:DUF7352 domain-containing protein [Neptuniibacter halophilus]|uniref:DUF7352 domain-containing protein n=1 Tax=Neptuniibacter halophilus TaxID=651666 RepID=UPI0025729979|nr:hypothetical protein [Neptuniibacter halophilus]